MDHGFFFVLIKCDNVMLAANLAHDKLPFLGRLLNVI